MNYNEKLEHEVQELAFEARRLMEASTDSEIEESPLEITRQWNEWEVKLLEFVKQATLASFKNGIETGKTEALGKKKSWKRGSSKTYSKA